MTNTMLRYIEQRSAAEAFRWGFSNMEIGLKKNIFTTTQFPAGSASVLVIEDNGLVLAVSRKDNHGDLGLPGGKIEPGETPATAASREAVEELGVPVCNPMLAGIATVGSIAVFIYRADLIGNVANGINAEGACVCWVEPAVICSGSFGKFNRKYILPILT